VGPPNPQSKKPVLAKTSFNLKTETGKKLNSTLQTTAINGKENNKELDAYGVASANLPSRESVRKQAALSSNRGLSLKGNYSSNLNNIEDPALLKTSVKAEKS